MSPNTVYVPSIGVLYYKGNVSLLQKKIVGVVGSRKASTEGCERASELSSLLSETNYAVLSGLAVGIDTAVHSASKENTIAVIPTSINAPVYPKENEGLRNEIIEKGGLIISPFKDGSALTKYSFIFRDKVEALLSSFLIVVESDTTGGSMHALRYSAESGRKVFLFKDEKRLSSLWGCKNIVAVDYSEFIGDLSKFLF